MINTDEECLEYYNQNLKGKRIPVYSKNMQNNYLDFFNYITNRFNDINKKETLLELIYRIENKIEETPKCPICGKTLKFINKKIPSYQTFCSRKCKYSDKGKEIILQKTIKTNLEKYGVKNPQQNKEIHEKTIRTCIEKYGVENPMQIESFREKLKQTCLKKYGVENSSQCKKIREKVLQTTLQRYGCKYPLQNKDIMNKVKQTNLEKYGVENPQQNKEIKEKTYQTCLKKYGVNSPMKLNIFKEKVQKTCLQKYGIESPMQLKLFKEKQHQSCLEKYGVEYPSQSKIIKQKIKKTCLEKYGVEHPFQKKEIMLKAFNTRYSKKTSKFSKNEDEIYNYLITIDKDTKRQYYSELYPFHCDFYLPKYNVYIEYQGSWVHGFHPFNENDDEDNILLEKWKLKSETSKYYKKAIYSWTISDVLKCQTAKNNNLNYLEIFPKESYKNKIDIYLSSL